MILQKENKVLRAIAKPVADFHSPGLKTLISKMAEAMFKEPDGIGIAAPQIGESLRVFLVSGEVMRLDEKSRPSSKSGFESPKKSDFIPCRDFLVFVNPQIKKFSVKKNKDVEGCLSVRGFYGEVTRPEKLNVEYFDEAGKKYSRGVSGLFARVIQHEVDHLNGALFVDKAKNVRKLKDV
ncbi:MAG: hypothetical protein UW30_C0001G0040 [Candidatus Giovannonibacteria bacterium GW2011_GWA2_44_13b]|uniref:Peptide deformylase n=2 Tax=Candidatus Giovannoniibacteriota TaxID=1752738 RepID=A0A0G1H6A4_9BACT|nr:MAG: hypothetical protein UW30_C0001G0040 [Candidatus Giovannonibacteria bacterium GW2011_GWA2_44_13b]OGF83225.1 MAG: hypothetical protein A2924_02830 [Candidatus Giovannonibacteria bacterium RIFCSPLOWO2_01_FULL_44_16]